MHPKTPRRRAAATRRRAAGVAAGILAATSALTACGPAISSGEPGTASDTAAADRLQAPAEESPRGEITIWDRSGDLFNVFDAVIDDFNEVYPDVVVHHEAVDIDAKLQNTLITETDVPDGVFLDDAKVAGFADHLWDLSGVMAPYLDDIAPQKVDVNSLDGGIYGVPFDLDPGLLYYNEKALTRAGIDATEIETYDDLLDAARAYQDENPGSAPIHLEQSPFLGQLQLEMYASQLGTSLADENGELRLDSDEYRQILGWLDTVDDEGLGTRAEYLSPSDVGALESGDQVFYPWAIWFSFAPEQQLTKTSGDWRAMPLPAWEEGGARSGAMGGSSFVLPRAGENADLAWLFYEFLMFHEDGWSAVWGANDTYPNGLATSIPAYIPAADPATPLFGPVEGLGGQDLWTTAVEAGAEIPGGAPTPSWWAGAVDYLGTNLQRMYDGDMTPDEVIEQSDADIRTNLVDRQ
ncbi:ABC transporter substrate-binding protein [Myceligenerans pegani]|uniref:Extracellular solute-binding protein n=1 Tax=Myceligenerans pegani TaxID=2776917 RepID=A0ABR9MXE8_9MICO|nr:extracellular solute-binding protein [Myceligenerans sp. TRM 65318]MBE1876065.1 extracellular solute-binding protein [Myceligenerans sp. TRM 65318]MBE3018336.1 extracellular solute-binding protein [Myceligenerans sp. TRM 65318]